VVFASSEKRVALRQLLDTFLLTTEDQKNEDPQAEDPDGNSIAFSVPAVLLAG
jgi:hypothetical protein